MSGINTAAGPRQTDRQGHYTGRDLDNNVIDADLRRGAVLQLAAGVTDVEDGLAFGQPTSGFSTPFAVLAEKVLDLEKVNEENSSTANLRDGGPIPIVTGGLTRALVKHGTALVKGVTKLSPIDGTFHLGPYIENGLVYSTVASSTGVNVAAETVFSNGTYTIPANSLRVGDTFRVRANGTASTGGDTLTLRVRLGGVSGSILIVSAAPTAVTNDDWQIDVVFTVRTVSATGTVIAGGISNVGTPSAAASAADIPSGYTSPELTGIDMTASLALVVTTQSGATNNVVVLNQMTVEKLATSTLDQGVFAVAMETTTINDSTNGDALAAVFIKQSGFW